MRYGGLVVVSVALVVVSIARATPPQNAAAAPRARVSVRVFDDVTLTLAPESTVTLFAEGDPEAAQVWELPSGELTFDVAPGSFVVRADAPGHASASEGPFHLVAGEPVALSFRLRRGHILRGKVLDARTREPVEGVRLEVDSVRFTASSCESGKDGAFEVAVEDDWVDVTATAEGYAPRQLRGIRVPSDPLEIALFVGGTVDGYVDLAGVFEDPEADVGGEDVDVDENGGFLATRVPPGAVCVTVAGTVVDGATTATPRAVQDETAVMVPVVDGQPTVTSVSMAADRQVRGSVTAGGRPYSDLAIETLGGGAVRVGPDGKFALDAMPGEWDVPARFDDGREGSGYLFVPRGPDVDFRVRVCTAVMSIRLVDSETGEAIAGVVDLRGDGAGTVEEMCFESFRVGPDAEASRMCGGRYALRAVAAGYAGATQDLVIEEGEVRDLAIALAPAQPVTVRGTVLDPSGHPAVDVSVKLTTLADVHGAESDTSGRFEIGGVPPGRYDVHASIEGSAPTCAVTSTSRRTCPISALRSLPRPSSAWRCGAAACRSSGPRSRFSASIPLSTY